MRKITFMDRVRYQMSYSLSERWDLFKNAVAREVAWYLPERVRNWVVVQRHAAAMTKLNVHPDRVSAFDLQIKR